MSACATSPDAEFISFSLSGALLLQATQYRGSTQYFAQDYPLSGNNLHILAFRN